MSRLTTRLAVVPGAALERLRNPVRGRPERLGRVLIAHHLLLGDTVMLTPLLAKLRHNEPDAEIVLSVPRAFAALYSRGPYGVVPHVFDPHDVSTLAPLFAGPGFDLAVVPGDNRYSYLALAAGARWIVAHAADRPAYKNWPVDEAVPLPDQPSAWGDMVAELVPGLAPPPYRPTDWPEPRFEYFELPASARYAVLHLGASTPLKLWEPAKWRAIAAHLLDRGLEPVLLVGPGEGALVDVVDPERRFARHPGTLRLEQVWGLLRGAQLLVVPDTGIAHLARLVGVPTVALFGPGSATVSGSGSFWRTSPFRPVTIPEFPCRDQTVLFRREVAWVRRCGRGPNECPAPRCMEAIDVALVTSAIADLLGNG